MLSNLSLSSSSNFAINETTSITRAMTFITDITPNLVTRIVYGILAFFFLLCSIKIAKVGHTQPWYHNSITIRFFFPLSCLISLAENVILALEGTKYIESTSVYLKTLYIAHAMVVPILLNATYEICYLVHKRRSVNFCGIFFDEGKRVKLISNPARSFVLRNLVRALGIILFVLQIASNFDLIPNEDDELAGITGWISLIQDKRSWNEKVHILVSLLSPAFLVLTDGYLSVALWRYGTTRAMVVHSSYWNPWFSMLFGTIAFGVGQIFGQKEWYPLSSNLGLLILIISVILVMGEVDKDMEAAAQFTHFLSDVVRASFSQSSTMQMSPSPREIALEEQQPQFGGVGSVAVATDISHGQTASIETFARM
mmetsp:Transcript_60882/g.71231  ORF Transcript_60882/g.71231 Transcript_60882/m.71231 type:complete len:369 (+) Transcript_60882:112-1218(+)